MMKCHDFEALLLDHLYGLLDAAETASVEAHLAGCANCSAARREAARSQGLLAQAAKSEFPALHFTAPLEEATVVRGDEPHGSSKKIAARRGEWVRWAVAASVLALIPGTLLPLSKLTSRYDSAKRDADDAAVRLADARIALELARKNNENPPRLAQAKGEHDRVIAEWTAAAEKAEQNRKISVEVTKPVAAEPGAPAEFVVAVADPTESLKGSRVEAQFRDQSNTVLFTQKLDSKYASSVRLPAEVWSRVTPQSELFLNVSAVNAAGERTDLQEPIRLFGPVYATMLVTDKATYRPGDRLYFRSLTLDRISFRPPSRDQKLQYVLRKQDDPAKPIQVLTGSTRLVKETDGNVETVNDHEGKPIRGVGCGAFTLPANLADGEYTLTLTELVGPGGSPPVMAYPVTRTIKVRAGAAERFTKDISFTAASYAAGGVVNATAEAKLGDKPVVGAKIKVVVIADGNPVEPVILEPLAVGADGKPTPITDKAGQVRIKFVLPPAHKLPRGDVKLMVTFTDNGVEESVAKPVPITGKDLTVEFFPEGGKLIAGVPNRVYVRGTYSNGKALDVNGTIITGAEKIELVTKVESPTQGERDTPQGLGSFTFTPKADTVYRLRLQAANAQTFALPKAETEGVTFTALDTVTKPGQPIRLRVHSMGKDRNLVVGAYTRGKLADTQRVRVAAGVPSIVTLLANADSRGGVTRITIFEEPANKGDDLVPVAERLVFRKPGELLNLTATAGIPGMSFAPGSAIDLTVAATDESGKPVPAILWAAAVNTAVAPDAKDRSLPTHFLLAGEVQSPDELEFADFLLTEHPKAAEALDHVLATQGWRRFAEQGLNAAAPGSPTSDLLKLHGQHTPMPKAGASRDGGKVFEQFWPRFEKSTAELEAAQNDQEASTPVVKKLYTQYVETRDATESLGETVRNFAEPLEKMRDRLTLAVAGVAILTLMLGLLSLARGMGVSGAAPYLVGTLAATGLAAYLTIAAKDHAVEQPADLGGMPAKPGNVTRTQPKRVDLPPAPKQEVEVDQGDMPKEEIARFHVIGAIEIAFPRAKPIPKGIDAKKTIPDDLLSPKVPAAIRLPMLTRDNEDASLLAKAEAHGDRHAVNLLQKLEAYGAAERIRASVPRIPPLVVREYAAPRTASIDAIPDTVLWQPVIVLAVDGKTTLHFTLGDAPAYQVLVAGHTADGRFGSIRTILPVAPKP